MKLFRWTKTAYTLPRGRMLTNPRLESSAWSIHSEDCVRLIFTVHLLLFIRVLLSQGTVPKTVYPWTIHSAPPLQLTRKNVPQFSRYFPPQTKLHFFPCFDTCSTVEDVCTYFLRSRRSNEFRRFCHRPDCFSTHAVIASTSTVHLPR